MEGTKALTPEQLALVKRYLLWSYKSIKDQYDRIERKTTQLIVDDFILDHYRQEHTSGNEAESAASQDLIDEMTAYIANKKQLELNEKYAGKSPNQYSPEYTKLKFKLNGVEKAITAFLGEMGLDEIRELYEREAMRKILIRDDH